MYQRGGHSELIYILGTSAEDSILMLQEGKKDENM